MLDGKQQQQKMKINLRANTEYKTWVKFKAKTIWYARAIITSCGMGLCEKSDAFFSLFNLRMNKEI